MSIATPKPNERFLAGVLMKFITNHSGISQFAVIDGVFLPNTIVPLHAHKSPEVFYVLEGELESLVNDTDGESWTTHHAGSVIVIPGNAPHALRNQTDSKVRALAVCDLDLRDFLYEASEEVGDNTPLGAPSEEQLRRLFTAAERHGYWLGSPSDNEAIGIKLPA